MLKKAFLILVLSLCLQTTAFAQLVIQNEYKDKSITASPGDTIETEVTFLNAYRDPQNVEVDVVDGVKTQVGHFSAKLSNDQQLFIGNWATLDTNLITLESGQKKTVKMIIKIPNNQTPGDYSGGITASKVPKEDLVQNTTTNPQGAAGATVKSRSRIAIPFYITVAGVRTDGIQIGDLNVKKGSGQNFKMYIPFENTGNTTLKIYLRPSIKARFNENSNDLKEIVLTLLPKEKVDMPIDLGKLPLLGFYDLQVKIKYNVLDLLTNEEKTLGEDVRTGKLNIIPWRYLIAFLLIVTAIILFFVIKKQLFVRLVNSSSIYVVKEKDTLATLASAYKLNWKTIAKINNIQPPYEIKPGQKILLPKRKAA